MRALRSAAPAVEIEDLRQANGWKHLRLSSLDAKLHHRPVLIPDRLRDKIRRNKARFARIYVAYADCGTRGEIDRVSLAGEPSMASSTMPMNRSAPASVSGVQPHSSRASGSRAA